MDQPPVKVSLLACWLLGLGQALGCADHAPPQTDPLQPQFEQVPVVHYGEQTTEQTNPPIAYKGEMRNGLAWTVRLQGTYTSHDSLVLKAELNNVTDQRLIYVTRDMASWPYLLVTPEGHAPRPVPIRPLHSPWGELGLGRPEPGQLAYGLHTDLRVQLGKMEPGSYTLQVVVPADAYAVSNLADYEPAELVSPPVTFTIQPATLEIAQDTLPDDAAVTLEVSAIEAIHVNGRVPVQTTTGTLTNRGDRSITFSAYIGGHEQGTPYLCIGGISRWTESLGWSNESLDVGWCGTGLGTVKLEPGESTELLLGHLPQDGIYRFEVGYWIGQDHETRGTVYSNAVLMDRWAQAYDEETKDLRARGH